MWLPLVVASRAAPPCAVPRRPQGGGPMLLSMARLRCVEVCMVGGWVAGLPVKPLQIRGACGRVGFLPPRAGRSGAAWRAGAGGSAPCCHIAAWMVPICNEQGCCRHVGMGRVPGTLSAVAPLAGQYWFVAAEGWPLWYAERWDMQQEQAGGSVLQL